ncbi:MAG: transposase [Anaerolineae bacterium]
MIPRDRVRSLAHRLVEAKSEGERLKAVEEESRRLLLGFKREAIEKALSLVVGRVLGPRWRRRGKRIIPWNCRACGSRWASQVRRNGHYKRNLVVGEGVITLRVPQVECKGCGRSISIAGGLLKPRSRYWIEFDKEVTEFYMNGVSHRKVVEILARRIQSSLSPMTSWRALQRVGEKVKKEKEVPPHKVRVVALDEITHRVRGERRYTLAAQDAERGEWLAMRVSESRKEEAWVDLLDQLWDRAISPDSGVEWVVCDGDLAIEAAVEIAYPGVKTQRCVWHLLKKAREVLEKRYPGQGNAERRSHLMGMIRGIFTTTREMEAHARFRALAQEDASLARYLWPQLKRGLEYLRSPGRGVPSTTSRMERAIREYRRRTRPMDGFKTHSGAENFNQLWMAKERARKDGQDWLWEVMS